jgi:transposase-like protein
MMSQTNEMKAKTNGQITKDLPDPEVMPTAKRRQFSAAYKRRILEETDGCTEPGEVGALLRREGLYSSYLTTWRRQRERGELEPQKRGRKGPDPQRQEIARLQQENERLQAQLARAEAIIDVQKKLSSLFGQSMAETKQDEIE